jgi:hypothetical protein
MISGLSAVPKAGTGVSVGAGTAVGASVAGASVATGASVGAGVAGAQAEIANTTIAITAKSMCSDFFIFFSFEKMWVCVGKMFPSKKR